ncbi:hypothetical protein [Cupriavidus basilensis]|nr:hypothetical protein [Cupriavidus basilensis]MDF3884907.1 hypothetical protein [Cupriavidus basilensis]
MLFLNAVESGDIALHDSLTITFADNQAARRVSLVAPDKARALSPEAQAA